VSIQIADDIEDEFQLDPGTGHEAADDSESASQFIAIEDSVTMGDAGDSSGFNSPFGGPVPFTPENDGGVGGVSAGGFGGGIGGGLGGGLDFATPGTSIHGTHHVSTEPKYTTLSIVMLVVACVCMILPGVMFIELVINMWSWNEPFEVQGTTLKLARSLFGMGQ
ncbi:MAG: hypothetical protein ACRCUY_09790, partial [Thermoguttaceae bacterium]